MARASTRTQLSLDRFTRVIGFSPILFNQVWLKNPDLQPDSSCSDPVLQYSWQPKSAGRPGREELANAILQAEELIEQYARFGLTPRWYADAYLTPYRQQPGGWGRSLVPFVPYILGVQASHYLIQAGQEAWATVEEGAAIVYSDVDGDGYDELATVTVVTTVTNPDEIEVFYPGESHDPAWEIRPVTVAISGGSATITFARHQAVAASLLEALDAEGVDGSVDANFLGTVDVYRHYNDPSQMATVEWLPSAAEADNPGAGNVNAQTAAVIVTNERAGTAALQAATWDAANNDWNFADVTWTRTPNRIRLWYRAGYRDRALARPLHDMAPVLERAVSYLALALLDREWLECEPLHNLQAHWRADLALQSSTPSSSARFQLSRGLLDNPLGTTRAAVYAWRVVQPIIVGEPVLSP